MASEKESMRVVVVFRDDEDEKTSEVYEDVHSVTVVGGACGIIYDASTFNTLLIPWDLIERVETERTDGI